MGQLLEQVGTGVREYIKAVTGPMQRLSPDVRANNGQKKGRQGPKGRDPGQSNAPESMDEATILVPVCLLQHPEPWCLHWYPIYSPCPEMETWGYPCVTHGDTEA